MSVTGVDGDRTAHFRHSQIFKDLLTLWERQFVDRDHPVVAPRLEAIDCRWPMHAFRLGHVEKLRWLRGGVFLRSRRSSRGIAPRPGLPLGFLI